MALNRFDEHQQDEKSESIGLPPYKGYTGIPVDIDNSLKAQTLALQKIYSRDLQLYGRPRSYHLEEMKTTGDTKRYQLVPNFKHRVIHSAGSARDLTKITPNPTQKKRLHHSAPSQRRTLSDTTSPIGNKEVMEQYAYVIVPATNESDKQFELLINQNSHYFLANKAAFTYCAGEIHFNKGEILSINDLSGAYNLDSAILKEKSAIKKFHATKSILKKLFAFDAPPENKIKQTLGQKITELEKEDILSKKLVVLNELITTYPEKQKRQAEIIAATGLPIEKYKQTPCAPDDITEALQNISLKTAVEPIPKKAMRRYSFSVNMETRSSVKTASTPHENNSRARRGSFTV